MAGIPHDISLKTCCPYTILGVPTGSTAAVCAESWKHFLADVKEKGDHVSYHRIIAGVAALQDILKAEHDKTDQLRKDILGMPEARPFYHIQGAKAQQWSRLISEFIEQLAAVAMSGEDVSRWRTVCTLTPPGPPPLSATGVWANSCAGPADDDDMSDSSSVAAEVIAKAAWGSAPRASQTSPPDGDDDGGPAEGQWKASVAVVKWYYPEENEAQWQCKVGKKKKERWEAYQYPIQQQLKDAWRADEKGKVVVKWSNDDQATVDFDKQVQVSKSTGTIREVRFHRPGMVNSGA